MLKLNAPFSHLHAYLIVHALLGRSIWILAPGDVAHSPAKMIQHPYCHFRTKCKKNRWITQWLLCTVFVSGQLTPVDVFCWTEQTKSGAVSHQHPCPSSLSSPPRFVFLLHPSSISFSLPLISHSHLSPLPLHLPSPIPASSSPSPLLPSGASMMQWFIAAAGSAYWSCDRSLPDNIGNNTAFAVLSACMRMHMHTHSTGWEADTQAC